MVSSIPNHFAAPTTCQSVTDDHQDLIPAGLPGTVNAPSSQSRGDLTQNAKADSAAPKSIPFKHMTEMATEGMPAAQAQVRIFNQMVVANLEPMQVCCVASFPCAAIMNKPGDGTEFQDLGI